MEGYVAYTMDSRATETLQIDGSTFRLSVKSVNLGVSGYSKNVIGLHDDTLGNLPNMAC